MPPLIVIRPEPGCAVSVAAARAAGLAAFGFPLFAVGPCAWEAPSPGGIDALLLGSANALRHGGAELDALRGKPAYVVGEKTAEAAREAGLAIAAIGAGCLQEVLARLDPAHRRLLRLAGRERVELRPPEGVTITERVVYDSAPLPMPEALAALLREPALVLLHSGAAARHFAAECDRLALPRAAIRLAAIGPRVAQAAGDGWARLASAQRPDDAALLALARQMCQTEA